MVCSHRNSRFQLALRTATASNHSHFQPRCRSKSTRGWVSPLSLPKYLHQSASASDASLAQRSAPTDHASERKLAAALLTMSLFRHIATSLPSAEKPYPTP